MGFFGLFGKRKEKEEIKEIKFSEIEGYLKKEERDVEINDKTTLTSIKFRLKSFLKELKEKLEILKNVDVNSKKADDRTKLIVKKGLDTYLSFSEDLVNKLSEIKEEKATKFLEEINNIIFKFDKNSNSNYHRANILIGKELVSIKEEIRNFSKDLIEIFNEDKKKITLPKDIERIRGIFVEFQDLERKTQKIDSEITNMVGEIKEEIEKLGEINKKIEEVKNSEEYLENLKTQERILSQEEELEQSILKLRNLIDFKYLTNIFHTDERQMKIVKDYRDDFKITFLSDSGESLSNLLSESKMDKKKIFDKINGIGELMNELEDNKNSLKPNKVEGFISERESLESKINELRNEKKTKEKFYENVNSEKEEIKKQLLEELKKMNINIK